MKAEDSIRVLETALSLTTSAEEYLAVLLRNIDALFKHCSRLCVRKCRFRRHCVRPRALSNIANELQSGREDVVMSVLKNDKSRKMKAKMRR